MTRLVFVTDDEGGRERVGKGDLGDPFKPGIFEPALHFVEGVAPAAFGRKEHQEGKGGADRWMAQGIIQDMVFDNDSAAGIQASIGLTREAFVLVGAFAVNDVG